MPECLNCSTPLEQIPHKRIKQFCNSTCRSNYWQKQKRKSPEGILHDLKKSVADKEKEKSPFEDLFNKDIQKEIDSIRAEKIPPERNTLLGKKAWQLEQQNRIIELQNKLK